jgi:N-acetyl-anhydromuramyl-L-alanine amidase AmpD
MAEIPGIRHVHSLNRGQAIYDEDVKLIVLRYTRLDSAAKAITWYCQKVSRTSSHVVIARDGHATQLVHPKWAAWHVPHGGTYDGYTNLNMRSVGIALDNLGPLVRGADGIAKPIGSGVKVPNEDVLSARHRHGKASFEDWHKYTEPQLEKLDEILKVLVPQYPKLLAIVGTDALAPLSELAPGPALPAQYLDVSRYR